MITCITCQTDLTRETRYHYNYGDGPYCTLCAPQNKDKERITCTHCGKVEVLVWDDEMNGQLQGRAACFTCNHFLRLYEQYKDTSIRINHVHYLASDTPTNANPQFLGHGGRQFTIIKDGKTIVTRNLWCQGDIPPQLHALLPDNAEWATP